MIFFWGGGAMIFETIYTPVLLEVLFREWFKPQTFIHQKKSFRINNCVIFVLKKSEMHWSGKKTFILSLIFNFSIMRGVLKIYTPGKI